MSKIAKQLLKGSVWRISSLVASILVGLYLMPFVIHAIGDRWYGMWTLIGSLMGYYTVLDLGLQSATQRFLALARGQNKADELNTIVATSVVMMSVAGLVAILISVAVSFTAPLFFDDALEVQAFRHVILILGVSVALTFVGSVFTATVTAHLRYDLASMVNIGALVVRATLVICFIGNGCGVVALAIITLSTNVLGTIATVWMAWKLLGRPQLSIMNFKRDRIRPLLNFGIYAFVSRIAYIFRFQIDSLVIATFLNLALVTHYAIAAALANYFQQLMIRALGIMTPVFARHHGSGDQERLQSNFLQATRFSVVFSTMVAGGILIFSDPFIKRWMGDEYSDAWWPLVFLISSLLFAVMQIPSTNMLYALAKHKFHAIMNVLEGAANLTLSIILVQAYGLVGVALGTAIPLLATRLFVYPQYTCRKIGLPVTLYYRQAARLFLLTAAGQLPLWFLVRRVPVLSYVEMLVFAATFYAFYSLILLRFVLPVADRLVLVDAAPRLAKVLR